MPCSRPDDQWLKLDDGVRIKIGNPTTNTLFGFPPQVRFVNSPRRPFPTRLKGTNWSRPTCWVRLSKPRPGRLIATDHPRPPPAAVRPPRAAPRTVVLSSDSTPPAAGGSAWGWLPESQRRGLAAWPKTIGPHIYCCGHIHAPWAFRPPSTPKHLRMNPGAPRMHDHRGRHHRGFFEITMEGRDVTVDHHFWHGAGRDFRRIHHERSFWAGG